MDRNIANTNNSSVDDAENLFTEKYLELRDSKNSEYEFEAQRILDGELLIKTFGNYQIKFYEKSHWACFEITDLQDSRECISKTELKLPLFDKKNRISQVVHILASGEAEAVTTSN